MRTLKWGVIFLIGVLVGSCLAPPCVDSEGAQAAEIKQPTPPRAVFPYGDVQDAEVKVNFGDGHCTGVLLSPNPDATESRFIATAHHCFVDEGRNNKYEPMTGINGEKMTGEIIANDGNDHLIVRLSKPVKGTPVWFGAAIPPPGTQVFGWGNPAGLEQQLRIGTVSGVWADPKDNGRTHIVVDINNWHGDSGGPLFDMQGHLISLNNGYYFDVAPTGASFRIGIVEPFAFTPEQLRGIP